MRQLKLLLVISLLCSFQMSANTENDDPDFKFFTQTNVTDSEGSLNSTAIAQIQFGTGGTGGSGVYAINLLAYDDSTCTTVSFSMEGVGNGHTTNPGTGIYSLSGTGLYNYYITIGFSTGQVAAVHSFKLQDSKHTGTTSNCIILTCTTSDCSYSSGVVATVTLNQ